MGIDGDKKNEPLKIFVDCVVLLEQCIFDFELLKKLPMKLK
jgi:hypothetical protein